MNRGVEIDHRYEEELHTAPFRGRYFRPIRYWSVSVLADTFDAFDTLREAKAAIDEMLDG